MARQRTLLFHRLFFAVSSQVRRTWNRRVVSWVVLFGVILGVTLMAPARSQSPPLVSAELERDRPVIVASEPVTSVTNLLQQGIQLYQAEKFRDAIPVLQQAVAAATGDPLTQALAGNYLGLAYQKLDQLALASDAIATSLRHLQPLRAKAQPETLAVLAQALNTQGRIQLAQGQAEQALQTWKQATTVYAQAGDGAGQVGSLINQAQALQTLGLYQQAETQLQQISQQVHAQPDSLLKATSLRSLGNALRLVGKVQESHQALTDSLAIAEALKSPTAIADTLLSLGNTAKAQNQVAQALKFYQQVATTAPSPTTQIQAQLNHLNLLISQRQWNAAQELIPPLEAQITQLPPSRASIYAQINFVQALLQDPANPRRSPQIDGATPNTRRSPQADRDAFFSTPRFRPSDTETSPVPGFQLSDPEANPSSSTLQLLIPHDAQRRLAQLTATAVQQAKALGDRRAESYALGTLGKLYEQTQQWSHAQDLTQQALFLSQSIQASDITYRWQWQAGRLFKAQNNIPAALAAYREAVQTLQSLRTDLVAVNSDIQFSFRDSVEPIYREYVSLLIEPGDQAPTQANLIQARNAIESLQLAELENFFRQACLDSNAVQIDQVDRTAAVIYPIILPDRLEVILSLPDQTLRHYATPLPQPEVTSILRQFRIALTNRWTNEYFLGARQVYNWLIQPAATALAENQVKTLVFVLDGAMRDIPMAALHDGQQFLIEKYNIALTPGLQLLDVKPLSSENLKVLTAGLSEARHGFNPLPAVQEEVQKIQNLVPSQVLLNQEFTSPALRAKMQSFTGSIVHLATHGEFSSNAEGTFILAWDEKIDLKSLSELIRQRSTTQSAIELLVLSACRTASGDDRAALGLAGVAVRAGARSTIGTLWYVDDAATSSVMVQFYREFAQGTLTKAEALRQAQRSLLQDPKYNHPYFWAPYILVGNWM